MDIPALVEYVPPVKSVRHAERAHKSAERADERWQEESGEDIETLHRTDHLLAIGAITQEQREQIIERLFPGFGDVKRHTAEGYRGKPTNNLREYRAVESRGGVYFEQQ